MPVAHIGALIVVKDVDVPVVVLLVVTVVVDPVDVEEPVTVEVDTLTDVETDTDVDVLTDALEREPDAEDDRDDEPLEPLADDAEPDDPDRVNPSWIDRSSDANDENCDSRLLNRPERPVGKADTGRVIENADSRPLMNEATPLASVGSTTPLLTSVRGVAPGIEAAREIKTRRQGEREGASCVRHGRRRCKIRAF